MAHPHEGHIRFSANSLKTTLPLCRQVSLQNPCVLSGRDGSGHRKAQVFGKALREHLTSQQKVGCICGLGRVSRFDSMLLTGMFQSRRFILAQSQDKATEHCESQAVRG